MLDNPFTQRGASWQVKAFFESGGELKPDQTNQIFKHLPTYEHWETKLHILQIFPYLEFPVHKKNVIKTFLDDCLQAKNKFVRAWAFTGLHQLASTFPEYQQEAFERLNRAMETESGSIKVRVRKALAAGF
ncbi:MAG: hypothetical protein AAGD96_08170 [Chloroflexota bacterium]